MDLGSCENRILSKGGAASMFEATKSWKGGFNMKKTYQEPVIEIVKLDIVDTTFATWASGAKNDPSVFTPRS